jgi:hypothetical protein
MDWSCWSPEERKVVVAHEVAHIARNDYLGWILAQLSLAIHFYHPLAHWLVGRLRLQQELAADEWGAHLAGSRKLYIATLARMALRQDVRPAAWPARSFFPFRGTFLRRIEMLRTKDDNHRIGSPASTRTVTFAVLAAVGLLLAGLRGPLSERALAQEAGAAKSGSQETGSTKSTTESGPSKALDLSYVPEDAGVCVAVRPSALLQRSEIRNLYDGLLKEEQIRRIVELVNVESTDQISVVVLRQGLSLAAMSPEATYLSSGVIVRSSKPRDWRSTAKALAEQMPFVDTKYAGQPYSMVVTEAGSFGYFTPDDRTVVIAAVPSLFSFMKKRDGNTRHPWSKAWESVANSQAAVAIDVGCARGLAEPYLLQGGAEALGVFAPIAGMISPLWEETNGLVFGLDTSEGLKIDLLATCAEEEGRESVRQTLQAVVTLAKNSSKAVKNLVERIKAPEKNQEIALISNLAKLGEEILANAKVEQDGNVIHLRTSTKEDVVKAAALIVGAR